MSRPLLPRAGVVLLSVHAAIVVLLTVTGALAGWPTGEDFFTDFWWLMSTGVAGLPWSGVTLGSDAGTDLLFSVSPWINLSIHAGIWSLVAGMRRLAEEPA